MSRTRRSGLLRQVMGPRRGRARVCAAYRRGPRPAAREARTRAEDRRESAPLVGVAFDVVERDSGIGGGVLAGALAYRLFFFLLPLGLVAVGALGVVTAATGRSAESLGEATGLGSLVTASVANAIEDEASWYALLVGVPLLVWVSSGLLRVLARVSTASPGGVGARGSRPSLRVTIAFTGAVLVWVALIAFAIGALDRSGVEGVAGVLGIAAALLFSLYLAGRLIATTAVLDATLWERRRARR